MGWGSSIAERFRGSRGQPEISEAVSASGPASTPDRAGFAFGIPDQGLTEYNQGIGQATNTDRRSLMQELYEAYLGCTWVWTPVQAIARTITAGGLTTDWDTDTGEGDQEAPDKPANVVALERLIAYCNPDMDIRRLLTNVVISLLVFGDAFIEVVWVGNQPVALYTLDAPTMFPTADKHGKVTGYVQITDYGQRAAFDPRDVIHISLDSPRPGVFGVSPTQAALLPVTSWLFGAAMGKEMCRKGLPATVHVDMPAGTQAADISRWVAQYAQQNLGPRNLGRPILTKGGATLNELATGKIEELEGWLDQRRDEILACFGVPPSKAGVIESGNLGGGTGESQDKTFRINTCQPIAELILEKLNFHLGVQGFGISGWHLKFRDVDYRDSTIIEGIRDMRLRNGSWTLDRYRTEIGEPSVPGGSDAVLVDRQNLVLWSDMQAMSKAMVASKGAPAVAAGETPPGGEPMTADGPAPPSESIRRAYRTRLREAMRRLPRIEEEDEDDFAA
jgi:hypothetical protein